MSRRRKQPTKPSSISPSWVACPHDSEVTFTKVIVKDDRDWRAEGGRLKKGHYHEYERTIRHGGKCNAPIGAECIPLEGDYSDLIGGYHPERIAKVTEASSLEEIVESDEFGF